jgi:hypothetical protein
VGSGFGWQKNQSWLSNGQCMACQRYTPVLVKYVWIQKDNMFGHPWLAKDVFYFKSSIAVYHSIAGTSDLF